MRLTTKGRYAVTAMLDIALHRHCGPVSVTEVAERQALSSAYLEQLFSKLKRAGLLQSVRGPGGGYELARPLAELTVSDIIAAVGEGVDVTRCQGAADCHDGATCLTHDLWSALSSHIDQFLTSVTLDSLLAGRDAESATAGPILQNDRQNDRQKDLQKARQLIHTRLL